LEVLCRDRILSIKDGNVIARNVFCDEAIPWITPGDCFTAQNAGFGKKRLAMTPHHKLLNGHPGPTEFIFLLTYFVLTLCGIGAVIFSIILFVRLVRAVEKIAQNFEK
jgi:hypothetical protein